MNIAFWCVLAAGVLPLISVAIAKSNRRYNNTDPRTWLEKQEGYRARANFAHQNHFEAFPFFAAGVIIATLSHVPQLYIDTLALGFVAARVVYTVLYLMNLASLRSVVWFIGYGCVIALFIRAAQYA